MVRHACDICGIEVDAPMDIDNFFGSVQFRLTRKSVYDDDQGACEVLLCDKCKKRFFYYMRNHDALSEKIRMLSLPNRLRLLFKKPIKV